MDRAGRDQLPLRERSMAPSCIGLLAVFDALTNGLLLLDDRGGILFANRRAAELLATEASALERRNARDVLAPLEQLKADGPRGSRKVRLPHGRVIDVSYTLAPIENQDLTVHERVHYALTIENVTEVLRLQEERDRLLKLATVGETLPSLLHELKNPLAAIASSVELLIEEASDPALRKVLHAILTEVRRAVLSLDGIGAIGTELATSRPSAVDHAITEVCTVLRSRALRAGIQLVTDVPALPLLHLAPAVIRALLFNLVNNSIHACTERGTEIVVRARLDEARGCLLLTVRDDGCGMDEEVLKHSTDLFFTTKRSGSGIGLSLVKRIVENAGGSIHIESQRDHGTQIDLVIPVPCDKREA
jgi:signal transduction histidine kinase